MKNSFIDTAIFAGSVFFASVASVAHANIGQEFGFGSRTGALGGAGVAWGAEGYFAYSNPAALPLVESDWRGAPPELRSIETPDSKEGQSQSEQISSRMRFTYSVLYVKPQIKNIDNVLVENNYTSDKQRSAGVDTNYRATFGQILGVSYLIAPSLGNFTLGVLAYIPMEQLAYFDTGETWVPEYFMHRARTQRPQFELGIGSELGGGFKAGVGMHVAYSLTSNATVYLQSGAGRSSMRFSASMKPKVVPFLGFHYSDSAPSTFAAGTVVRFPVQSNNRITVNTGAHIFPNLRGLDFNFAAGSALFYDPLTIETGASIAFLRGARTYLQLDYEAWSRFKSPAILIEDVELTGRTDATGVIPNPGAVPDFQFRDILIPKIGEEISLSDSTVIRVGYTFRPGIIKALPTGAGNYLDPSRHILTAGFGLSFKRFLSWNTPCTLDFHGTYHSLQSGHVEKTPTNEGGDSADSKIGSPGYDVGGKMFGGGASVSLAL